MSLTSYRIALSRPAIIAPKSENATIFFGLSKKLTGKSGAPPLEQDGGNLGEQQNQRQDENLNRHKREETAEDVEQSDVRGGDRL